MSLGPVEYKTLVMLDEDLVCGDRHDDAEAMSDVECTFLTDDVKLFGEWTPALSIVLPVIHKVTKVSDVKTSTRYLPKPGVLRLTLSTRSARVASLLEKSAAKAGTNLADFTSSLALIRLKWASPAANFAS